MMKKVHRKATLMVSIASLLLIVLPAFTLTAAELPKSMAIATHPKGSSLNAVGSGIGKVISAHTSIMAVDRPFTGYLTWIPMLDKGSLDMGIGGNSDIFMAYRNQKPYRKKHDNLRLISSGSMFRNGYISRADSGIKTISDLKGKRATIDPTTDATKRKPLTAMKCAGLDPEKDVTLVPVAGVVASMNAFMEGRADVGWASIGMGKVKEANAKLGGVYWVSICKSEDGPDGQCLLNHLPEYRLALVKAGSAPEVKNDFWVLESPINLVSHKGVSDEAAYLIAKTIWENYKELAAIHPLLKQWRGNMVSDLAVVPYHPGAIRFYMEVGAWTDKMEGIQKKLLSE